METLPRFENLTGEGVVSFEPWEVSTSGRERDPSRWFCHLNIAGQRIYEFGSPCGTCGIVYRMVGRAEDRICDDEAVRLLGDLSRLPDHRSLQRLARPLEPGVFHPLLFEAVPLFIHPGSPDDYFAHDAVRLFGLEPPGYTDPSGPWTPYYKFGLSREIPGRTGRLGGPHKALALAALMPLHSPTSLDRGRIEFWKERCRKGFPLTAFAISVIDNQAPAMEPADRTYSFEEHFLFAHCLLDGHHRVQAAAELSVPVRLLSFLSPKHSLTGEVDLPLICKLFAAA